MMLARQLLATSVVVGSTLLPVSGALADDVSLTSTGPGSTQGVTIDSSASTTESNVNSVSVANANGQQSTSGQTQAKGNTQVGNVNSGAALNQNNAVTTVSIANATASVEGSAGSVQSANSEPGSDTTGLPVGGRGGSATNGAVLGASTDSGGLGGGLAALPAVGPSVSMDVSVLRAAWTPHSGVFAATMAQPTRTNALPTLILAACIGLLAGISNAAYLRRKEIRS